MSKPPLESASWRARMHEVIFEAETPAGKFFDVVLLISILMSVAVVMLESMPSIGPEWQPVPGKNMYEITDANGVKIVQELIKSAKGGGGFVSYVMPKLAGERPLPKISYVGGVEQWEWFIGTGAYISDINKEYESELLAAKESARGNLIKAAITIFLVGAVGYFIAHRTAGKTLKELALLEDYFEKVKASEPVELTPDDLEYTEFKHLASVAKEMVDQREEARKRVIASEERMDLAMEAAEIGFWDWDILSGRTFFSPRYFLMLGYDPGELPPTLETWESLLHPEDKKSTMMLLGKSLEGSEKSWRLQFRMRHKNGGYRWIVGRGKVVSFDEEGKPLRATGTHVDITQRVLEEGRFSALVNSSPWGIFTYKLHDDGSLVLTGSNNTANKVLGIDCSALTNKTIEEAFPALEETEIPGIFRRLAKEVGLLELGAGGI